MEVKQLDQQTSEWHEWRLQGIGGSDCAVLMGHYEYGTPFSLWSEKLGLIKRDPNEYITQLGQTLEPKIRAAYSFLNDLDMPPALVQNKQFPWIRASLDGYNKDSNLILEIKYLARKRSASDESTTPGQIAHDNVKLGIIPDRFIPQVMHQMMAAESDKCDFVSCLEIGEGDQKSISIEVARVTRDDLYIKKLFKEELAFWEQVLSKTPPPFVKEDFKSVRGKGMKALFTEYLKVRSQIEAMLPIGEERMRFGNTWIFSQPNGFDFRVVKQEDETGEIS